MTDHERFTQDSPDTARSHPVEDNKAQTDKQPSEGTERRESNDQGSQGKGSQSEGTHGRPSDDSDPGHS